MKLALHSVSYAGLWRGQACLSLREFLQKAAALGYQGVELMGKRPHLSPLDFNEAELRELAGYLMDLHLKCACIAGYTDFTQDGSFIPVLEMQLQYIEGLARIARQLGCPVVRVFTGYEKEGIPYWTQWNTCVAAIRECCSRAAAYGVDIGIQNHHDIAVDASSLAAFIDEVDRPNCKAMFDAWAPAAQGLNMEEAVKIISDKIAFTTAADYTRVHRFRYDPARVNYLPQPDMLKAVPMGEGFIDYKAFFEALVNAGYDGYVSYEMCSELAGGGSEANLDRCARAFVTYMKNYMS